MNAEDRDVDGEQRNADPTHTNAQRHMSPSDRGTPGPASDSADQCHDDDAQSGRDQRGRRNSDNTAEKITHHNALSWLWAM